MDKEWIAFLAGFSAKYRDDYFAPAALRAAALEAYRRKIFMEAYFVFS